MKKSLPTVLAFSIAFLAPPAYAATSEYDGMGSNALNIINAQSAYDQGYTGRGVQIGVCDFPTNFAHPDLNGVQVDYVDMEGHKWDGFMHGSHVSGIVAANKDGIGMHGVAYDAYIIAGSPMTEVNPSLTFDVKKGIFDSYLDRPEVKVINNSWGSSIYISEIASEDGIEKLKEEHRGVYDDILAATNAGKLLVFAAANSGHITSAIEANYDYLYKENNTFSTNLLSVTAANSNAFERKEDGSFYVTSLSTAVFSDLAMFNEDSSLTAPGFLINSANADFAEKGEYYTGNGSDYTIASGTSMAAPVVTGVGALVQQAFPYLGGKQIGDVLLSTANANINNTDGFYLTAQGDNSAEQYKATLNIFFTGEKADDGEPQKKNALKNYIGKINGEDKNSHQEMLLRYLARTIVGSSRSDAYYDVYGKLHTATDEKLDEVIAKIIDEYDVDIKVHYNTPTEMIFGQGMVDAGAAVKGLGAINVRRLSKNDISDAYTVAGNKEKQALYTVDTMGYDSVWSNDIKEIRAGYIAAKPLTGKDDAIDRKNLEGLEDLQKRYEYYYENFLKKVDGKPVDDRAGRVQDYMDYFNKNVADCGLAGLHAGLVKEGEGILALAGNNTYKGSSIARGGVLQIDGSVAGDAYSEGTGTIAGSGTIYGNMYNNGQLMAGSPLAYKNPNSKDVQGTLNIEKDLTGNGTIVVNQYDSGIGQIQVTGKADISNMKIQAGTLAAPNMQGEFIAAGTLTGNGKISDNFSGLLDADVVYENNTGTIATKADNNTGGNHNTFKAVDELYSNLDDEAKKEMYTLYGLQKDEAAAALTQLKGGLQLDLAHDALQNRDVRFSMEAQETLEREDSLWGTMARSWHNPGSLNGQSYTMTLGKDFVRTDDYYAGAFFSYSDNSLSGADGKGEYDSYSVALYASTHNKPSTISGYISYGLQDNEVERTVNSGAMQKLSSDYDSNTISAGVKYSYDLHHDKGDQWHLKPYAQTDFTHYNSDGFTERGSVYSLGTDDFSDNYWTGGLGLELERSSEEGTYGFQLGYEHTLTGEEQRTAYKFANGTVALDSAVSQDLGKNKIILGAYADTKIDDKWTLSGRLDKEWGDNSHAIAAQISFNYSF